ncbi:hypothetical protein ACHQM5_021522 [Ranunculus cassubicifolius]
MKEDSLRDRRKEMAFWFRDFEALKKFESVFKVSRKTFNYVCSLVDEDLQAKPAKYTFCNGKLLSTNDQVAVALRRLSSGESLLNVGDAFGLNQSTVSQVTWRFIEALEERGLHRLQWPTTESEMESIKTKFEKIRGLPNCCGAICWVDDSNDVWYDREKNHSMVLQAIVDPDMRFRDIVTGWPGSMTDIRDSTQRGTISELREYIVGDSGFPLLPFLITPYQGKDLSETKTEFNKRHFATRMVAQRELARLKEMWRIIQGVMWRPDKHKLPRILLVCCLLHNIVIDLEDEVVDEMPLSHHHDVGYRQQMCEFVDNNGSLLRERLSLLLSGRLPP